MRVVVRTEQEQPAQLANTLNVIEKDVKRDALLTEENCSQFGEYIERDWQRWHDQQAEYRRWIYDAVKGNPQNLEPVAIILFY